MAKIVFFTGDGCLFSGVAGLVDAFSIANLWQKALHKEDDLPLFQTEIVTADGKPVFAHGGIPIYPDKAMTQVTEADVVMIAPFLPNLAPLPDNFNDVRDWITERYSQNNLICAICTGAFLLAETGLLDGKLATTNWQFTRMFKRRYPKVKLKPEMIITMDSGFICSGAATAAHNLGLYLIEKYGSAELASICAKAMLIDPSRDSQAPYMVSDFQIEHNDAEIKIAQKWMETHYKENITIDSAAGYVGISPRHFKRRFKSAVGESPLTYLQRVRIEAAKKSLENTKDNINEITFQIGYEDSSSFRRLFKKFTGLSPREYRDKFQRAERFN